MICGGAAVGQFAEDLPVGTRSAGSSRAGKGAIEAKGASLSF